ncbi:MULTISPECIES: shikimate dehydrogenase [unclassified Beijerinckia]|uniref:shikimate dehydrogenase n=1 Tax=unclassified Beijerinckia TaxID=2638183 RepID=UPI000B8513F9|nr:MULTISPECIES: shikimate dehydrogenase [unclassified Beijerinckia]
MAHGERFLLAGVIGWPVMHSKSPMLHNYWLRERGLAGTYIPLEIAPEGLAKALKSLHPLGFAGCNLTIPHKQAALAIVDEIDPLARTMGAISCVVVRPDGSLFGANNDCYGFIENIVEGAPQTRFEAGPAVVLGAGGGARAVAWGLAQRGVPEIRLINRTRARAEEIAREFGAPVKAVDWSERNGALEGCALLVNTTSQGMVGMEPLDIDLSKLPRTALVTDIVYAPLETPLLKAAKAHGNPTVDGLGMLLHQARPAWQAWFNIDPKVTPELRRMIEATL